MVESAVKDVKELIGSDSDPARARTMTRCGQRASPPSHEDDGRNASDATAAGAGRTPPPPLIAVIVPVATRSPNKREHWGARARRVRAERIAVVDALRGQDAPFAAPLVVTLTRIGARRLDGDNLQGALKGVRDGVAGFLGVDDGDPRITWRYAQQATRERRREAVRAPSGGVCRYRVVAAAAVRIEVSS